MRTTRCVLAALLVPAVLAFAGPGGLDPVNKTGAGLALKGYDAVAYFTEGRPVSGDERYEHTWKGARWLFVSAGNRDAFAKDPERYAPVYGGYCAYAVSHGYTADGDPQVWKIVEDRLYLNYNREAQKLWGEDIPGNIAKGDENWPRFLERKPEHKG